jgi:hypothetical protein
MVANTVKPEKSTPMTYDYELYTVDLSTMPPSCLPTDLDGSNLVDITRMGDPWRRYLDTHTGKTHDGAEYWAHAQILSRRGHAEIDIMNGT